jgi:hypothetical protein
MPFAGMTFFCEKYLALLIFCNFHFRRRLREFLQPSIDYNSIMNWIILVVAGFCEVGFTYCLGHAKAVEGLAWWSWMAGKFMGNGMVPPDGL